MICRVSVHVFVDESRRSSTYLLAAAILDPGQLTPTRVLLRGLRMPGERKIHFKHERDAVQKDIAARLVDARLQGRICHGRGPDEAIRAACLSRLVDDALAEGCTRLVLDARGENGDRADRRTISRVLQRHDAVDKMVYEHLRSHEDRRCGSPMCSPGAMARAVTGGVGSHKSCSPWSTWARSTATVAPCNRKREARVPSSDGPYPGSLPRPNGLSCL
jgi:hypothetical protein